MTATYSDISPNAFSAHITRLLLLLGDLERLALETGLDEDVVRLCQTASILNNAIKTAAEGQITTTKRTLTSIVEEISEINNRLVDTKPD